MLELLGFARAFLSKRMAGAAPQPSPDPLERQRDPRLDALMEQALEDKKKQVLA